MPIIPLINFAKGASRTGSVSHTGSRSAAGGEKLANVEGWRIRKETEKNGRREEGFLVKKGCKEGGGSL